MKSEKLREFGIQRKAASSSQQQSESGKGHYLTDNRSDSVAQRKLMESINATTDAASQQGPVQRKIDVEGYKGGELFLIEKEDLGTGTGTSEETRSYVNNPGTPKPSKILFDYGVADTKDNAKKKVAGNHAWEVDNPKADHPY